MERDFAASNQRMTRLEQSMERDFAASNQRMTRLEQSMERDFAASNQRIDAPRATLGGVRQSQRRAYDPI